MSNKKFITIFVKSIILMFGFLQISCNSTSNSSNKFDLELIPVGIDKDLGYVNSEGKFIINPQFEEASFFTGNGLAKVKKGGKYGFINKKGEMAIPATYENTTSFYEGLACVVSEGTAPFYINEKGEKKFELSRAEKASFFAEGLAAFSIKNKEGKELFGFIDKEGKEVISPTYEYVENFSEGLVAFKQGDKWGFLDKEGKIAINPQFYKASTFKNGFAIVSNDKDKWGSIDKKGIFKIEYQFDDLGNFSEGLAAAKSGKQWGYVNQEGKLEVNPQFDKASEFKNGVACIEKDNKGGLIDKAGKIVANPQFDKIILLDKFCMVELDRKAGITDLTGKYLANPQFNKVGGISEILIETLYDLRRLRNDYINSRGENPEERTALMAKLEKKFSSVGSDCYPRTYAGATLIFNKDNSVVGEFVASGAGSSEKKGTYKVFSRTNQVKINWSSSKSSTISSPEIKDEKIQEEMILNVSSCEMPTGNRNVREYSFALQEGELKYINRDDEKENTRVTEESSSESNSRKAIYKAKSEKVYFLNSANYKDRGASFIVRGQTVTSLRRDGEFVYVTFTYNGVTTKGYIALTELELVDYLD
jgi:hypothetical protein